MDTKQFYDEIVHPSLVLLDRLTAIKVDQMASIEVMAIAGQESDWEGRRQVGGPARSFWQFERGGGVAGLFSVLPGQLKAVCGYLHVPFDSTTVFEAMAWNDVLACCMARLLLYSDPRRLPDVGDVQGAWSYYQRNWRPGLPHPEKWPHVYSASIMTVGA